MGSFVPTTREERAEMLAACGLDSFDALYADVPASVRLTRPLALPAGQAELAVRRAVEELAAKNTVFPTVFRGAGAYRHYIPSVVRQITGKEEFVTAYTPYQAEISQGILQSIFEFQTMICELTGMDAANASVYNGAEAAAEATAMCRDRKRGKTLISAAMHPDTIATVQTYCYAAGVPCEMIPLRDGRTDPDALASALTEDTACVLLQQPNFFGLIEETETLFAAAHAAGAKAILSCNPMSLALLQTPADCGADIAVGDAQPFGLPLAFGGPYLGFMACTAPLTRRLPGRIVGETTDSEGRRAYVLTLQAREQHIRREKASSNICSNQAWCALNASVYLAAMGPDGLREAASQSAAKAHFLAERLADAGLPRLHTGEFFHEFVTVCPGDPQALLDKLAQSGILGGLPVNGGILWCATELNTREEIERTAALCGEVFQ